MDNLFQLQFSDYFKRLIRGLIPDRILFFNNCLTKVILKSRHKQKSELSFEVHCADHCNLNCKGCSHFSPLVNNRFLDINIFKRDCLRISELGKEKIKEIRLLGGEPLLHPQLCDVIDIIGTLFNKNVVTIVTNGILLLEQKNIFWNICSKYNAKICITKYPVKINFKAIEKMARKYSVNLVYYGNTDVQIKTMHCIPLDLSGMQKKSFDLCFNANNCPQLRDGKIFPCATAAYFEYFNDFFCKNIQTSTEDYIDIYKTKTIDEILAFLCHPVPFCRYCKTQKTIRGIKWGISEKEISEWVK